MRAVVQRVSSASVTIGGHIHASIGPGFLVLLGIEEADDEKDLNFLVGKITQMRVFSDTEGKMNLDLKDTGGELLVISQFTLHASTKKGNWPSFIKAAKPEKARPLYDRFIKACEDQTGQHVKGGVFGADMKITLVNDGPVTILLDSKNKE